MNLFTMNVLILCTFVATTLCAESYMSEEFVDYSDMRHYNRYQKSMNNLQTTMENDKNESTSKNSVDSPKENTSQLQTEIKRFEIFMKSFVNRFLRGSNLENKAIKPDTKIETELPVRITSHELNQLVQFGSSFTYSNLTDLDHVLSSIMTINRGYSFHVLASYLNPMEELFYNMTLEKTIVLVGLICCATILWMFAVGQSLRRIMIFAYLICFMFSILCNAWRMYTEALAEQFASSQKYMQIPEVCNPAMMSWFSYFFSNRDDCKEYHKSMRVNPISKVSLTIVLSETVSMMLIHPLRALGLSVGDFLSGVSKSAPWPLNFIFLPVVFIVSSVMFLFMMSVYMGASLKFWTLVGGVHIFTEHHREEKYKKILNEFELKAAIDKNETRTILTRTDTLKYYLKSETKRLTQYVPKTDTGDGLVPVEKPEVGDGPSGFSGMYYRSDSTGVSSSAAYTANNMNGLKDALTLFRNLHKPKPTFRRSVTLRHTIFKKKPK